MKKTLIILTLMAALLPSCKKDSWIDWRIQNQLWLEKISEQPDVLTTPTGLRYKVIREGLSNQPHPDDIKSVKVTYTGSLIGSYNNNGTDGNVFDSAESATLEISGVISGFAEGLKRMTATAHYILYIPSDLAYGEEGKGSKGGINYIPPYSTLIFDVRLEQVY